MAMTVSAHDIAAVLRAQLPELPVKKLHKLLYYCQGHHLAAFDEPLFRELVSAWDMGPVVGSLWRNEKDGVEARSATLGEAELNTIGYVISRYGSLTGQDLENLSHGESPWQLADLDRQPGGSTRITNESLKQYFRTAGAPDAGSTPLDSEQVREWLSGAEERRRRPRRPDSIDALRARLSRSA